MMPRRPRRLCLLAPAALALPGLSIAAVLAFAPGVRSAPVLRRLLLPAPARAAWVVPPPALLPTLEDASRWAPVAHPVLARAAPANGAAPVAEVHATTPEGTTNILELLGPAQRERSGLWQRVTLAVLPNGTTGWVPVSALGGSVILDTRLVIDRRDFRAVLFRDGVAIFTAPVGVGEARSPTPAGTFYVRDLLTRYASPAYGPVSFGTSARSAVLTEWPAGGYIGIHGTDEPQLIPGAISHGCIRMRNADITKLARLMPVGTPVIIR
jgi:lipoprotein-anchoring transpeptidase ErfK/SrfK